MSRLQHQTTTSLMPLCSDRRAVNAAVALLKALGNRSRFAMLIELGTTEYLVGELSERLGVSPSGCSQHLRILEEQGLVNRRRRKLSVYYSLNRERSLPIMSGLACSPPTHSHTTNDPGSAYSKETR